MQQRIKILLFQFIWSSTCFGRHTAHHQEPKTALAASGFSYVEGCWTCSWWTLSGTDTVSDCPSTTRPTTFHVWKTRGYQCSFRLLMMGSVSPETCWASCKYGIIKFWYIVTSCWIFLYEFYYDARIHEHHRYSECSKREGVQNLVRQALMVTYEIVNSTSKVEALANSFWCRTLHRSEWWRRCKRLKNVWKHPFLA